jgi:VanZ family protein
MFGKQGDVPMQLKTATRFAAWSCLLAIGVLSLLPADDIVRTSLGAHVEHVLAYACTSLITALAYRDWPVIRILVSLVIYAALLEYLQRFSPGRVSSIVDFAFSSAGVVIGIVILELTKKISRSTSIVRMGNDDVNH